MYWNPLLNFDHQWKKSYNWSSLYSYKNKGTRRLKENSWVIKSYTTTCQRANYCQNYFCKENSQWRQIPSVYNTMHSVSKKDNISGTLHPEFWFQSRHRREKTQIYIVISLPTIILHLDIKNSMRVRSLVIMQYIYYYNIYFWYTQLNDHWWTSKQHASISIKQVSWQTLSLANQVWDEFTNTLLWIK